MRLNRNTMIFAVVLIAIIAVAYWQMNATPESDNTDNAQATAERTEVFAGMSAEEVSALSIITYPDEELGTEGMTLALVRNDDEEGTWSLAESSDVQSEQALLQADIDSALATIIGLQSLDQFAADDLAPFGLDAPAKAIEITIGEETRLLRFGDKNPQSTRYYALLDEDATVVYLLTGVSGIDTALKLVDEPPFEAIPTPTPVPILTLPGNIYPLFNQGAVSQLTITDHQAEETMSIIRDEETQEWVMEEDNTPLDQTPISIALSEFGNLVAVDGLPGDNLEPLGLDDPSYTIMVQQGEESLTLRIGVVDVTETRYYALVNDFEEVAVLPADATNFLLEVFANPPLAPEPEATAEATEESAED